MEVARGHVGDRPFARTLYKIGAKRFTGDLTLSAGGRSYRISWEEGAAVAAQSPHPSDQAVRVALAAGLIDSTLASQVLREMGQAPKRDPIEIVTGVARLSEPQERGLKRRLLAARAARVFALEDASFVLDNARSLRADPSVKPLDVRWLIYHGLRTHYSIQRLKSELAAVLARSFLLAEDAARSLSAFGLGDAEQKLVARMRARAASIDDLRGASPGLDEHALLATVYALVACDCLRPGGTQEGAEKEMARPRSPRTEQTLPPPPAGSTPAPSDSGVSQAGAVHAKPKAHGPTRSSASSSGITPPTLRGIPGHGARSSRPRPTRPPRPQKSGESFRQLKLAGLKGGQRVTADEVKALITEKLEALEAKADYFALLGVTREATDQDISIAYFKLAKRLHPDRLQALGLTELGAEAQRVFAEVNQAFAVLSSPAKRSEYRRSSRDGNGSSSADAEQLAARLLAAEQHFKKGEMALRRQHYAQAAREFGESVELNPEDAEHHALYAWATWCASADKAAASAEVGKRLAKALSISHRCVPAWFYRGQVAKDQGDSDLALECFEKVIELRPKHHEAALELRLLRSRRSAEEEKRGGLFRRKR